MARIGVEFGEKQVLQIDDISVSTGIGKSKIARAAMQIGLKVLRESEKKDEVIAINDLKALN